MDGLNKPVRLSILLWSRLEGNDCASGEAVSPLWMGELPVDPNVGAGAVGLELEKEFRGRMAGATGLLLLIAHAEADGRVEDRVGLAP